MRRYFILLAGVLAAFGGSVFGSFHFDDYSLLSNPVVTRFSGVWRVWNPVQTRPLTYLSFWFNYRLGATNPIGYHGVNLLLHAAAVLLLFHVLRKLIGVNAAFIAAGLFAIHPIQSEAVAYIFARGSLLCTLFCLLSLNELLRGRRGFAVLWFGLALLAKEECVTFPIAVLLLLASRKTLDQRNRRTVLVMLGLSFLAGARAAIATRLVPNSGAGFSAGVGPLQYFGAQGIAICRYLRLLVVPWGFTIEPNLPSHNVWLGALAWLGVFGLAIAASRRFMQLKQGFWYLAGLILLLPSSSVFPAADFAADRRMYLPMIAFAPVLGVWAQKRSQWTLGIAAVGLVILSMARMEVWRTEQSLWREAVRASPHKLRPLIQLARYTPPEEALNLLQQAKAIAPRDAAVASELGTLWMKTGQNEKSLAEFGRALAIAPHDPNAIANRGAALLALGQNEAARRDFERALRLDPCLPSARSNLAALGFPVPACPTAK